jgi:hypothetical protein
MNITPRFERGIVGLSPTGNTSLVNQTVAAKAEEVPVTIEQRNRGSCGRSNATGKSCNRGVGLYPRAAVCKRLHFECNAK